jgi:hypothetical protein
MTALRVRIAKLDPQTAGPLIDLPRLLEFWFEKLDSGVMHLRTHASKQATAMPLNSASERGALMTYSSALTFILLDEGSPWHMKQDVPDAPVSNVALALATLHDRMYPRIPRIVENIEKQEGSSQ